MYDQSNLTSSKPNLIVEKLAIDLKKIDENFNFCKNSLLSRSLHLFRSVDNLFMEVDERRNNLISFSSDTFLTLFGKKNFKFLDNLTANSTNELCCDKSNLHSNMNQTHDKIRSFEEDIDCNTKDMAGKCSQFNSTKNNVEYFNNK